MNARMTTRCVRTWSVVAAAVALLTAAGCVERLPHYICFRTSPPVSVVNTPRVVVMPFGHGPNVQAAPTADEIAAVLAARMQVNSGYIVTEPSRVASLVNDATRAYSETDIAVAALAATHADVVVAGYVDACRAGIDPGTGLMRADIALALRVVFAGGKAKPLFREFETTQYAPAAAGAAAALQKAQDAVVGQCARLFAGDNVVIPRPQEPLYIADRFVDGVPLGRRTAFGRGDLDVPLVLELPPVCNGVTVLVKILKDGDPVWAKPYEWDGSRRFHCFPVPVAQMLFGHGPGDYTAICRVAGQIAGVAEFRLKSFAGYKPPKTPTPESLEEETLWKGGI